MFVEPCKLRLSMRQEVKTTNALSVLQYSCSARTMALHTGELNARRCAPRRAARAAPPVYSPHAMPLVYPCAALAAGSATFVRTASPQPALHGSTLMRAYGCRCPARPTAALDPVGPLARQAVQDGEAPGGRGGDVHRLELLHAAAGARPRRG